MPSHLHEALVELFRHRPSLAAELLSGPLEVELPAWQQARLESSELNDLTPTEYRADAVVVLTNAGTPVLAVVIEAQLRRDPDKRYRWPHYLTSVHARLRCPAVLLVVCADPTAAGWCARPVEVGHPGWVLVPLVLGPDRVPVVTDAGQARRAPELAVLSAMAHGSHREQEKIFRAMLSGLRNLDQEHAGLYADVVLAALPAAARRSLEALIMDVATYEPQSELFRRLRDEARTEGREQGRAEALLEFLAARGIEVPEDARARIAECSDSDQLEVWIRRAATVSSVKELFD